MLKSIKTDYKKYTFRSRLEARWAVFFDELGIDYEYEPRRFDLGKNRFYLPDFLVRGLPVIGLPDSLVYIEIKPEIDIVTRKELDKVNDLAFKIGAPVLLFFGSPWYDNLIFVFHVIDGEWLLDRGCFAEDGEKIKILPLSGFLPEESNYKPSPAITDARKEWKNKLGKVDPSGERLTKAYLAARHKKFQKG